MGEGVVIVKKHGEGGVLGRGAGGVVVARRRVGQSRGGGKEVGITLRMCSRIYSFIWKRNYTVLYRGTRSYRTG